MGGLSGGRGVADLAELGWFSRACVCVRCVVLAHVRERVVNSSSLAGSPALEFLREVSVVSRCTVANGTDLSRSWEYSAWTR